jgi:hypothetical protein
VKGLIAQPTPAPAGACRLVSDAFKIALQRQRGVLVERVNARDERAEAEFRAQTERSVCLAVSERPATPAANGHLTLASKRSPAARAQLLIPSRKRGTGATLCVGNEARGA